MYAKIENGNVVKVGVCPQNTERTSNFYLLSDEEKKLQGWYKVVEDNITLKEWQSLGESTYEIINGEVYETKQIISMTLDNYKVMKYTQLANNTKIYVMSITPEYKQLSAIVGNYPQEECDKIKAFGKAHVDLVRATKALIFSATSYEQVEAINTIIQLDYDTLEPKVN